MMRTLTLCALPAVLALATGCSKTVDKASAQKVMSLALNGTVSADGQLVNVDLSADHGKLDVALEDKNASGDAKVDGTLAAANGVIATNVDVVFTHWTDPTGNLTLDGSLHEVGSFSTLAPIAGDVKLSGTLAASGDVDATVDVDLTGTYSLTGFDVSGEVGGQQVSVGLKL